MSLFLLQVLQESLSIPGSDLHLVYHSSHAHGYLSTIHLQLTPFNITSSLKLVHLHIVIEGIFFEKIFEADPEIKFTYAWNKRNVYKQKVYGLATARGNYFFGEACCIIINEVFTIETICNVSKNKISINKSVMQCFSE